MSSFVTTTSPETGSQVGRIVRLCRRIYGRHVRRLMWVNVASLVSAVCEVLAISLILLTVRALLAAHNSGDEFQAKIPGTAIVPSVAQLLLASAAVIVIRTASRLAEAWFAAHITADYENEQRLRLIDAFLHADWSRQRVEPTGRMQILLTNNISIASRTLFNLGVLSYSLISLGVLLAATLAVDWQCALVVLSVTSAMFFAIRPLSLAAQRRNKAQIGIYGKFANDLGQGIGMARELRMFNVVDPFFARISAAVRRFHDFRVQQLFANNVIGTLYQNAALFLVVGGLTAVYFTGFQRLDALGMVVLLLLRSVSYGQQLQSSAHAVYDGASYLEELVAAENSYARPLHDDRGSPLPTIETIAFRGVGFGYDERVPVLRDVSFEVKQGETIGIVGPSGSGKTTLLQLLLRLYEPQRGTIQINGRPQGEFSHRGWFARFAFVPQESLMFDESVSDSIRFLRPSIDDRAVRRAAEQAGLLDEIASLPDGFETLVGERGLNLSGGQRQRLSIARAMAGGPEVLVFDEPTSALDVHTESAVLQTLAELKGEVTMFLVAHRLSTLRICDRVMVLQDGEVRAFDAPETLAENDPYYSAALRLSQTH